MKQILILAVMAVTMSGCGDSGPKLDPASVARGSKLAEDCTACHELKISTPHIGPSLKGVIGRKAGTVSNFEFSDAMKNSGIVWTPDKIEQFVEGPLKMVPGTKMGLTPLSANDASDIVAYLQSIN